MKYFNSIPLLSTTDNKGNFEVLRNLLIRTELIPQLAKNPLLFYKYELREGDTPESVANKYYGDQYRYWIVFVGNSTIMDPQGDWPLTSPQFLAYLRDKYAEAAGGIQNVLNYTNGTTHHYEKIITTVDNLSRTTVIKNVEVDEDTYNTIIDKTETKSFPNGSSVTYTISKSAVSIYDYENGLNEAKRNIQLINASYASQVETQYKNLVSS
jgi:hypothetical protein